MVKKKAVLVLLAVLYLMALTYPCIAWVKTYKEGYENTKWGMSKKEVKRLYPGYKFKDVGVSTFINDVINGENVKVQFILGVGRDNDSDKLFQVKLKIQGIDDSNYEEKFNHLRHILLKEYGKPYKVVRKKINRQFEPPFNEDITLFTLKDKKINVCNDTWKTKETTVILSLNKHRNGRWLTVLYWCKELDRSMRELNRNRR